MTTQLKAPFPYFGGKSAVADLVWSRLGDVRNYIEPFCGSVAVLLRRPHEGKVETVNDVDCYIANFWRAVQADPEAVVDHADGPVNEADLHARHRYLVLSEDAAAWRQRMREDPTYYDARVAGWWVWGQCMWIGGGWCSNNPAQASPTVAGRPVLSQANGMHRKRPQLCNGNTMYGPGIQGEPKLPQKRPVNCGNGGSPGVHRKMPVQLPDISGDGGAAGRGIHGSGMSFQGRPQMADAYSRGRGVHGNDAAGTCAQRRAWLLDWFGALRDRLRPVRVCCGDWSRVCSSHSVTTRIGLTGVFLDPPYAKDVERVQLWRQALDEGRDAIEVGGLFGGGEARRGGGKASRSDGLYASDAEGDVDKLVAEVQRWCLERGTDDQMRIALCGYAGEHDVFEQHGWTVHAWKAQGGYGNRGGENVNKGRERIWFSPACIKEKL